MENRNIATFVKVVEFNSFTKAAENLGYSQATVTAQIKSLETELDVLLFDRIKKRIYLTDAGKKFLPYAINMLKAEEEAINSVKPSERLTGELILCSASSFAAHVLPDILIRFNKKHPGVNVNLFVSDYLEDTTRKIERGEIDFLICLDEKNIHPELKEVAHRKERLLFVTHPDNELLMKRKVSAEDIAHGNLIVAGKDYGYGALLGDAIRSRHLEYKPIMDIGSVKAILKMLIEGVGISLLPEYVVSEYIHNGKLSVLDVADLDISMQSYFLCSRNRWINPVMKAFIEMIQEY